MKISRELEQKILATPGVVVRQAGFSADPALPEDDKGVRTVCFVEPGVAVKINAAGEIESLVALLPVMTRSEANERGWAKKMRRGLSVKRAVRETLGPHHDKLSRFALAYHAGRMLMVTLTRLGGRRLDPCNLPTSMKAVEDVVAGALLADDGSPCWSPRYEQRPGGNVGVEVKLELFPVA